MATLVEVSEKTSEKPRAFRQFAIHGPWIHLALLSILTLMTVALHGFHPYADDAGIYVTATHRVLDPTLYSRSLSFADAHLACFTFSQFIAAIVRLTHFSLISAIFVCYLMTIWLTLFACFRIAERCFPSEIASWSAVTLLAAWLTLPVAGTALSLCDPYLTGRSFSTPLILLSISCAIDHSSSHGRRIRGATLWLVLAAIMHPLMAAYCACFLIAFYIARYGWQTIVAVGASTIALVVLASRFAPEDPSGYADVAVTRTYWYPSLWHWYEFLGLFVPLFLLYGIWTASKLSQTLRRLALASVITGIVSTLIAIAFARPLAANHFIASLQPLRAFHLVYIMMTIALGGLASQLFRRSIILWPALYLPVAAGMLFSQMASYPGSNHLELSEASSRNQWVQAFLWARVNTPVDALFALDAHYIDSPGEDVQSFRAISLRSSLADYSKDGGVTSVKPSLSLLWKRDLESDKHLDSESDEERIQHLGPRGVQWIVMPASTQTQFDCPYSNRQAKVCRMP